MVFYRRREHVTRLFFIFSQSAGEDEEEQSHPAGERLATLGANKSCGNKVGVVVAFEVHVQQLLLPEGLFTLAARERLLSCVGPPVHDHMALLKPQQHSYTSQLYREPAGIQRGRGLI